MSGEPESLASRATLMLLGLMATAFLAWAGVVWSASERLTSMLFQVSADVKELRAEVRHMTEENDRIQLTMRDHTVLPHHIGGAADIVRLEHEISDVRSEVEKPGDTRDVTGRRPNSR